MAARELPSGTVTLLFTDIEGSTRLLEQLGRDAYVRTLAEHRRLLREVFTAHEGVEVEMQGDSFHFAFPSARAAVVAAVSVQQALHEHEWESEPVRVRIGLHTGEPVQADGLYAGLDVHRAARVMDAAHGGQVLLTARTAELIAGELPDGINFRDLGKHRLKDLDEPQPLFQALGAGSPAEFPPLKTVAFDETNLPVPSTPLVGRERELTDLAALLTEARVVTLTGAGGTGKTRLALQAAAESVGRYVDGVWWVPLHAVHDASLVLPTIARTLGAKSELAGYLGDRHVLLVLDNFEQVLDAAADLSNLLAQTPYVRVLVTSREPLRIAGEQRYPVEALRRDDAATLFLARARAVDPGFAADDAVAEICKRLDDLPLALELAAARVSTLDGPELLRRLERTLPVLTGGARDVPARQRTLRATLEWSYDLLDDDERRLFARLAIFAESFAVESVEEICDVPVDVLQNLVEKSLARRWPTGRFGMLELVREFAAERLEESDEAEHLRGVHAAHYLALAEASEAERESSSDHERVARLEADYENLRNALAWFLANHPDEALRLAAALLHFWDSRDAFVEGGIWTEAALEAASHEPSIRRALVLSRAALFRALRDDARRALPLAREGFEVARLVGDRAAVANALGTLGSVECELELPAALATLDEALALYRDLADRRGITGCLHLIGERRGELGDYDLGRELLEQSIAMSREGGNDYMLGSSLDSIAVIALEQEDVDYAERSYRELIDVSSRLGSERLTAYALAGLSVAAAIGGRPQRAGVLWGALEPLERHHDSRILATERARFERLLRSRVDRDSPEFVAGLELGRMLGTEAAVAYAVGSAAAASVASSGES